jgi:hypothetical protein
MRGQATSSDLNRWMLELSKQVGTAIEDLQAAGDEAPEARAAYELAFYMIYEKLPVTDSVVSRKHEAERHTVAERAAKGRAENRLKRCESVLKARMAQLSALQSVAASVREEARFVRTGPDIGP